MAVIKYICDACGIGPEGLAGKLKLNIDQVQRAMGDPTALTVLSAMEAHLRFDLADLEIVVQRPAIDRLLADNVWRRKVGMIPYPMTRAELRLMITQMREAGKSYADIADAFYQSYIPTGEGLRVWQRTNIGQYQRSAADGDTIAGPEVLNAFRPHAVQELIGEMCWFAPQAPLIFQIDPVVSDLGCGAVARKRMPLFLAKWMVQAVKDSGWFSGSDWLAKDIFGTDEPAQSADGEEEEGREAAGVR